MEWNYINPIRVNPESFNLEQVTVCKVKEFRGQEDLRNIWMSGWNLFVNLQERCPVTGNQLNESTWYIYAAQGMN